MIELQEIRSKKHPGAVFLKVKHTEKDFVLKVYPEHEHQAHHIKAALEKVLNMGAPA